MTVYPNGRSEYGGTAAFLRRGGDVVETENPVLR
jgi:hypothetical protein